MKKSIGSASFSSPAQASMPSTPETTGAVGATMPFPRTSRRLPKATGTSKRMNPPLPQEADGWVHLPERMSSRTPYGDPIHPLKIPISGGNVTDVSMPSLRTNEGHQKYIRLYALARSSGAAVAPGETAAMLQIMQLSVLQAGKMPFGEVRCWHVSGTVPASGRSRPCPRAACPSLTPEKRCEIRRRRRQVDLPSKSNYPKAAHVYQQ